MPAPRTAPIKDVPVTIPLDEETANEIRIIADTDFDGNRAGYIRWLIRQDLRARKQEARVTPDEDIAA